MWWSHSWSHPYTVDADWHQRGGQNGIRQLETAAAKGKDVSTDARMFLIIVYNREKRYDDAMKIINELHGRYPRNFVFEMSKASTYGKMKRWDDAVQTYEQIIGKVEGKKDGYERLAPHKVYYSSRQAMSNAISSNRPSTHFHVAKSKEAPPDAKANAIWMEDLRHWRTTRPGRAAIRCDLGSELRSGLKGAGAAVQEAVQVNCGENESRNVEKGNIPSFEEGAKRSDRASISSPITACRYLKQGAAGRSDSC